MVLLGAVANPLQDSPLEMVMGKEVLDGYLLDCNLFLPGQQWDEAH